MNFCCWNDTTEKWTITLTKKWCLGSTTLLSPFCSCTVTVSEVTVGLLAILVLTLLGSWLCLSLWLLWEWFDYYPGNRSKGWDGKFSSWFHGLSGQVGPWSCFFFSSPSLSKVLVSVLEKITFIIPSCVILFIRSHTVPG